MERPSYEVKVQGGLGVEWSVWFDGLQVTSNADGTTTLAGSVPDQAALHGLLARIRDLGLPLLSVELVPSTDAHDTATE